VGGGEVPSFIPTSGEQGLRESPGPLQRFELGEAHPRRLVPERRSGQHQGDWNYAPSCDELNCFHSRLLQAPVSGREQYGSHCFRLRCPVVNNMAVTCQLGIEAAQETSAKQKIEPCARTLAFFGTASVGRISSRRTFSFRGANQKLSQQDYEGE